MDKTYPSPIRIGSREYEVIEDEKLSEVAGVSGAAMVDTETILVDPGVGFGVARETLLHELLHCVFSASGLGAGNGESKRFTTEQEEEIVWTMSPLVLSMLRDNPGLVTWLLEERLSSSSTPTSSPSSSPSPVQRIPHVSKKKVGK
jgi:hypothetical protein